MIIISRRCLLAIAAVVDVGLNARPVPVSATHLAQRLNLPPRHLEALLQALVHADILKGMRGPRGGYELARERRKITVADVIKVALSLSDDAVLDPNSPPVIAEVVAPVVRLAGKNFFEQLSQITIDDLCAKAETVTTHNKPEALDTDYTI